MSKRIVIWLLANFLLTTVPLADAQQAKKVPRVGFLSLASTEPDLRFEAFRQGLRGRGYGEGQNMVVEYRQAGGKSERLPELATELVGMKLDVIVAAGALAAQAMKKATTTIPIVISGIPDPVGTGLVASLAHPGGNLTGTSSMTPDIQGKRLELLKEVVPRITRVAVLGIPGNPGSGAELGETKAAARVLRVQLKDFEVKGPENFATVFSEIVKGRNEAVLVRAHPVIIDHRRQLADLAIKHRLPTNFQQREHAEAGGLMSYGPPFEDHFRRAAYYVDRILKGTKPADLPVEQPMKFELVFNLRTAKQIGLTIPQWVLMRADKVIR